MPLLDPDAAPASPRRGRGAGLLVLAAVVAVAVAVVLYVRREPAPPVTRPTPSPTPSPRRASPVAPPSSAPSAPEPRATATPRATEPAGSGVLIESDVPGATVFVDRQFRGTAPLTLRDLSAGPHSVNASAEGYEMQVLTVDVTGGTQTVQVRFKEVRLAAAVDVVHKHGVGSCRGRLSATPAGLRYEASKPEDAFTTPLADIAALEVDYLDKTLKLKLRNGRTYRFSPAAGGPDALLVFQQQVQKAVTSLRAGP